MPRTPGARPPKMAAVCGPPPAGGWDLAPGRGSHPPRRRRRRPRSRSSSSRPPSAPPGCGDRC